MRFGTSAPARTAQIINRIQIDIDVAVLQNVCRLLRQRIKVIADALFLRLRRFVSLYFTVSFLMFLIIVVIF